MQVRPIQPSSTPSSSSLERLRIPPSQGRFREAAGLSWCRVQRLERAAVSVVHVAVSAAGRPLQGAQTSRNSSSAPAEQRAQQAAGRLGRRLVHEPQKSSATSAGCAGRCRCEKRMLSSKLKRTTMSKGPVHGQQHHEPLLSKHGRGRLYRPTQRS